MTTRQNNETETQVTLFFDMDGVLARYEPDAYVASDSGRMSFQNEGYFCRVEPDLAAVNLFQSYTTKLKRRSSLIDKAYTLSTVSGSIDDRDRMIADKLSWIQRHLIATTHGLCYDPDHDALFAFAGEKSKPAAAEEALGRPLCRTDILIDDFNQNLYEWNEAGGTAVKYLNGINSPSTSYRNIDIRNILVYDAKAIMDCIARIAKEQAEIDSAWACRE